MQAAANTLRRFRRAANSLARADRDLGCGLPRRPARSWTRGRPVDDHPGDERPRRTKPAGREGRRSISRLAERISCPSGSYRARRDRPGALRLEMLYLQGPQQIRAISHRPRRRRAHVHAHKPRRVRGGRGAQATSARPRQNAQIAERGERAVSHLSFATRLSGVKRTSPVALQRSAFGGKADMTVLRCTCLLLMWWTAPTLRHRECHRVVASKRNHIEGSRPWARLARSGSILRSRCFRFTASMQMARW